MIEGLHFDVTAVELGDLLLAKANEHDRKAATYREMIEKLGDDSARPNVSRDPSADAKNQAAHHETEAQAARFMLAHLATGETYRLTKSELHEIGVLKNRGW